jgi:hypothetical protein
MIMKNLKCMSFIAIVGLFSLVVSSCETNKDIAPQEDILPNSFSVDIPSSISNRNFVNGGRIGGRSKTDSLKGNDIYKNLGTFIAVGEEASKLVEDIIKGIKKYRIERVVSFTFISDDDKRTKNLVVVSAVEFEGKIWDYQLTVTDVESQGKADGGKAIQVFWNKKQLVSGIAIVKPYNSDRVNNVNAPNAVFRIDYWEGGNLGYDAQMEVRIAGLPLGNPLDNPFAISSLQMFAGKKGDVVDVFGNSNHPNATLFSGQVGFDWAFVASGNDRKDLGVAEVGLPPSTLNSSDRTVLLKDYSIKNVFTSEIKKVWPGIDPALVANYLKNTAAPGYFSDKKGFISGGVSPGAEWDVLANRLGVLKPYNPKDISSLTLNFK